MLRRACFVWLSIVAVILFAGPTAMAAAAEMESVTAESPLPQPRVVKGPVHVAYVLPNLTSESCQRDWQQAQIEIKHRGWKVSPILDAENMTQQRNGLQALIDKNVDAIVITYWGMEPLRDLILEARKKGIGVYCVDTELRPGVIINTTQANGAVGARMAHFIIDKLDGKGKVAVLNITYHILRQRCYAARGLFTSKIDWPNLELVAWEDMPVPGWEKASYDAAAAWVLKYGDKLDAIFAGWDTPGIFASKAIEAAGFNKDQIFVTGIDGGSEAYDMIRRGSPFVATMSQPFEEYVHNTFEVVDEVQVKGIKIGSEKSSVPSYRTIYSTPVLTTIDNLPEIGSSIHEVFRGTYYNPDDKNAWYFWGPPYKISKAVQK